MRIETLPSHPLPTVRPSTSPQPQFGHVYKRSTPKGTFDLSRLEAEDVAFIRHTGDAQPQAEVDEEGDMVLLSEQLKRGYSLLRQIFNGNDHLYYLTGQDLERYDRLLIPPILNDRIDAVVNHAMGQGRYVDLDSEHPLNLKMLLIE